MIGDMLVIDATVHGFNFGHANLREKFVEDIVGWLHALANHQLHPAGDPRYQLTLDQFRDAWQHQPDLLETILFGESATDIAVYHGVPLYGFFADGSSPIRFGLELARRFPHRAYVYADVSPWMPDPVGHIDRVIDQPGVIGVKFYPVDLVDGTLTPVDFRDAKHVLPLVEQLAKRGMKVIAVHKAVPLGPLPRPLYHVDDMAFVVSRFPEITFEIVHGGFAFADQSAELLADHANVTINLETNPCFAINHRAHFARMMEPLLATGAWDRIFYATGASAVHPRPVAEAVAAYRAPDGFIELTAEMKRGILGENFARVHRWDVDALKQACRADRYGLEDKPLDPPWSRLRAAA